MGAGAGTAMPDRLWSPRSLIMYLQELVEAPDRRRTNKKRPSAEDRRLRFPYQFRQGRSCVPWSTFSGEGCWRPSEKLVKSSCLES